MMSNMLRLVIPASLKNLSLIRVLTKQYMIGLNICQRDIFQLLSVIDELSTNVVEHGYNYEEGDIILEIHKKENNTIKITVEDNGVGFIEEKLSKEEGGMGLNIAKAVSDEFRIEKKVNGTVFKIKKKIKEEVENGR